MPYLNSRLCALLVMSLSLLAAPGLHAQDAPSAPTVLRGDVDGDGRVTRADADAVRTWLVRGTLPDGRAILPAGDANGDGRVTAADAALISRYAAGMDVSRFPVGQRVGAGGDRRISGSDFVTTEYECSADFRSGSLECGVLSVTGANGARMDLMLYEAAAKAVNMGGGSYSGSDKSNPDTMTYNIALWNRIPQPIGTKDGTTVDTSRLVVTGYQTPQYGVTVQLDNADGTATFVDSLNGGTPLTYVNKQYKDYTEVIAPNDTSSAKFFRFVFSSNVTQMKFTYRVWTRVEHLHGWVTVAAPDSLVGAGQTLALSGSSFNAMGAAQPAEAYTWSSSNPAIATVDVNTGVVQGVADGTVTITATSNTYADRGGERVIRVIQANLDAATATGNVRVSTPNSVLTNDTQHPLVRITFAGWNGTPNVTMQGGQVTMDTAMASGVNRGKFVYNPPAGYDGLDSLAYTIQAGTAVTTGKVAITVQDMIWFVNNGGAACTTRASGCGRLTNPYSSLAAFAAENNGTGDNPAAGQAVFLYESASPYTGPVTLLANQKLIGQDAGASLATLSGITPATGSDALPAMNAGAPAVTIAGASGGVVLGADNLVRGFSIATTGGAALSGNGFGTPTIAEVPISATGGAALSLTNGTLNSTFPSVSSTNSTGRGISLTNVSGSPTFTTGSISGAAQAALLVSGGSVGFTWPGTIGQSSTTPLLAVSGGHSGTLTFSNALTAANGPGMQFNDADGTYNFNGTASISGDSAGVDITNGSAGTFNFNNGTQITNSAGAANSAFYVYGSAPTLVSYAGSITKNGTSQGRLVELGELTGGTVTFTAASTLNATSTSNLSTGIGASNVAATVNFDGSTTLNGGDAGVDITGGSTGTFTFSANTLVQNPTGTAFNVNGSTPNITFDGSLFRTANNALLVDLTSVALAAGKTITFNPAAGTDSLYATIGDGIQLSNVDGAVDFNGRVRLAGGNAGVDIVNGSSGNIDFDAATIVNPTGEALRIFNGSGGDQPADVAFVGSITTNAGRPVLIEDVSSGTVAVSASINATAGQGIAVQNNTGGTFTFSSATQTLNTGANAAVTLSSNGSATTNFTGGALTITTAAGAGFSASSGGTVNVTGNSNVVSSGTGTAVSLSSTTIGASNVRFRSVSANGGANGIFLSGTGNTGQFQVTGDGSTAASGGTIQNTTGTDGQPSGNGVYMDNVSNVSLAFMQINDHGNNGIRGNNVNGLTLNKVRVTGVNGTTEASPHTESAVNLTGLTGSASITGSRFSGGKGNNFRLSNSSGTLNRIVMTSDTFAVQPGNPTDRLLNDALLIQGVGTATLNATIQSTAFQAAGGDLFQYDLGGTAVGDLILTGNAFSNSHSNIASGGGGVVLSAGGGGSPTFTYNVANNTFRDAVGTALVVSKTSGTGTATGTITGNQIGVAGVAHSGSLQGSGIDIGQVGGGTHTTTITGNTIRQFTNFAGILTQVGNNSVANGGQGRLRMTIQSNLITELSPTVISASIATNGVHIQAGLLSGDNVQVCAIVGGAGALANTLNGTGANGGTDIRLRALQSSVIALPGIATDPSVASNRNTFLTTNNESGETASSVTGGSGTYASTCPF